MTRNGCRWVLCLTAGLVGVCVPAAWADDPNAPPEIVTEPQSQTVCVGDDVTLSVTASGESLEYQWYKDDDLVSGAIAATLYLDAVTTADHGDYWVVVSNDIGNVTSATATVAVAGMPDIITQPESAQVCPGASHTLTVEIEGVVGSTTDSIGSTGSAGTGARMRGNYYRVDTSTTLTRIEQRLTISTSGSITYFVYEADNQTGPYTLIVEDTVANSGTGAKFFASNALNVQLVAGKYYIIGATWPGSHAYYWDYSHVNTTSFGVSLNGYAYAHQDPLPDPALLPSNSSAYMQRLTTSELALTYQWRLNDEDIIGAGAAEYIISDMSETNIGDYDVVISSECGLATSQTASVTLGTDVTIEEQPVDTDACAGGDVMLSVVASGPTGITYQWTKGGEDIVDANMPTLTLGGVTGDDAGSYSVVVTSECGDVTSAAAEVTVSEVAPSITEDPNNVAGCIGQSATFTVVAEGDNLAYQWLKDDEEIEDADGSEYTIETPTADDAGVYQVVVSNACGNVTSAAAVFTIAEQIAIEQQPEGGVFCAGGDVLLSVVATGSDLTYQWRKDDEDITNANSPALLIEAATPDDSGTYRVVVSNDCGDINSTAVDVTVVAGPVIAQQPQSQDLNPGDALELAVTVDLAGFPRLIDNIGSSVASSSSADKIRANSYTVTESVTLTRIEQYLTITTESTLHFFVYESESDEQGPYSLIYQGNTASPGTGTKFFASPDLELSLVAGRAYVIGAAWEGNHTYYWESGGHPQTTAFGESVHGLALPYQWPLPSSPTPTSTNAYCQRLTTVYATVDYQWRKDGVEIEDATAATYSIQHAAASDAGCYDVVLSNECGIVTSDAACITVRRPAAEASSEGHDPDDEAETPPEQAIRPESITAHPGG